MKRLIIFLAVAVACTGVGRSAFRAAATPPSALSKLMPAGAVLYIEAKNFTSLVNDWDSSEQKKSWVQSDNYESFSRSRLFLRLKAAGGQFAVAAGLPPDMSFISQIAGERSALAVYDIGKLQFLYVTDLRSARSMQTTLWQGRAKFEPRNAAGQDFYVRRDPESQREVAFAVSGDYLLLATREDLLAGALQFISGKQNRSLADEPWWMSSTAAAGQPGDLRMVLDLKDLVPNGYFRTYWVQQNITDLSQYAAAVSDLFRSDKQYREERVLIRKAPANATTAEGAAAVADLARLIPADAGMYQSVANPASDACFELLVTKLLAPHPGQSPVSRFAPQVHLTSGEQGGSPDLETRIDQSSLGAGNSQAGSELKALLDKSSILASLQVQSSQTDSGGVFVRLHSAIVLAAASPWDEPAIKSAIVSLATRDITAGKLGLGWNSKSGYEEFDGLWPIAVSVRGNSLIVSDDSAMMESVLAKFPNKTDRKPLGLYAGFSHPRECVNFSRLMGQIDHPSGPVGTNGGAGPPRFFSGNAGSLSTALADVLAERVEVVDEAERVRQTVTYEWSR